MKSSAPANPRGTPRDLAYYVLAAGAGLVVGAVGSLFHMAVDGLSQWPDLVRTHLDGLQLYLAMSAVAATMVAGSIALVRAFAPEAAGSGVQEIEGALEGLRPVRWKRVLPVKFVGGVLALGS